MVSQPENEAKNLHQVHSEKLGLLLLGWQISFILHANLLCRTKRAYLEHP